MLPEAGCRLQRALNMVSWAAKEGYMGRKYIFDWSLIGNLELGRPNLGPNIRLEVYRLMQYCLRDAIEEELGAEGTDKVLYKAGHLAGEHFFKQFLSEIEDFSAFVRELQTRLRDTGIGILRVEQADLETGTFVLTVSEDVDCSGLPEADEQICTYDEGFIAGLLDSFTGKKFFVKEIDCWATGDRTCRFTAKAEG